VALNADTTHRVLGHVTAIRVGLQFLREMPELSPISIRVLEQMELATTALTELVRSVDHPDAYDVDFGTARREPGGPTQA
jgi:hypothetical protein